MELTLQQTLGLMRWGMHLLCYFKKQNSSKWGSRNFFLRNETKSWQKYLYLSFLFRVQGFGKWCWGKCNCVINWESINKRNKIFWESTEEFKIDVSFGNFRVINYSLDFILLNKINSFDIKQNGKKKCTDIPYYCVISQIVQRCFSKNSDVSGNILVCLQLCFVYRAILSRITACTR